MDDGGNGSLNQVKQSSLGQTTMNFLSYRLHFMLFLQARIKVSLAPFAIITT